MERYFGSMPPARGDRSRMRAAMASRRRWRYGSSCLSGPESSNGSPLCARHIQRGATHRLSHQGVPTNLAWGETFSIEAAGPMSAGFAFTIALSICVPAARFPGRRCSRSPTSRSTSPFLRKSAGSRSPSPPTSTSISCAGRRPADLIGEARLLKLGKRLAVGEVAMFSDGSEEICRPCDRHLFDPAAPDRKRGIMIPSIESPVFIDLRSDESGRLAIDVQLAPPL